MSTPNLSANQIRATFLQFFKDKEHKIVPSAPLVLKNDPTLLFTNAGMNQFKDYFLGYQQPASNRVADTQKCLRVSGKHNDLEDVGMDTYHHTMFEMLGNWSFGDYFKEEAIAWAWELLTDVFGIGKDQLYVTVFEGDKEDGLEKDEQAYNFWKQHIAEDRILNGNKKDNFWEMGDTGPCGPCSDIHIDIRPKADREAVDGKTLVNQDHPQVVEVWNLVFMQFNRMADGSLQPLAQQHIDTGMGFERLCMVLQGKTSNYDTDVFTPLLDKLESLSGKQYKGSMEKGDIAMRVISDHIRAIAFAIADGQLPSNTGAGYVIRRILRRAVRYGYSFLDFSEPFLGKLVPVLSNQMGEQFPELLKQQEIIEKVITEEEKSFLRTLDSGLKKLEAHHGNISGEEAFELYDTYGFPLDLTMLIASEKGVNVDEQGFNKAMTEQRDRSRKDAKVETGDWTILKDGNTAFIGYDSLDAETELLRYRTLNQKGKNVYQLVLNETPFYAESGGQIGDKGSLQFGDQSIAVYDTKKEGDLIIHFANELPNALDAKVQAKVNKQRRIDTENNHTATHLLHEALRRVIGDHVEQKGSLVSPEKLRFDFSHFSKLTDEELEKVEKIVNEKIAENISRKVEQLPFDEAIQKGATALFGEKYGDVVRVITFDDNYSVELCGGCHVSSTAQIRLFKIVSESASAAGIRRIEAITGQEALNYYKEQDQTVHKIASLVSQNKNLVQSIEQLIGENKDLQAKMSRFHEEQGQQVKQNLKQHVIEQDGISFIGEVIDIESSDALKNIAFELKNEIDNLVFIVGAEINGKPLLTIMIADNVVKEKNLNAGLMIKELAKQIKGGGGGQPFYATAGGSDVNGLQTAVEMGRSLVLG